MSTTPKYTPSQRSLKILIEGCQSGIYTLPFIQREYKWKPEHEIYLFDSLINDYTIRDMLMLVPSETNKTILQPRKFDPILVNDTSVDTVEMVLDGQQRLTAAGIIMVVIHTIN